MLFLCAGDDKQVDGNERTGHHPPTSPPNNKVPPMTTTAMPTPLAKDSDTINTKEAISSTTQQPAQSHSDSKPGSNSDSGTDSSDHTSGNVETPPTKQSSANNNADIEVGGVDKSVLNQGKGHGDSGGVRDCGRNGCDGSGVIAIVVVASVCFIIIVLVVAVLLKKVITDNRRRRFKNVDYLINGMYT